MTMPTVLSVPLFVVMIGLVFVVVIVAGSFNAYIQFPLFVTSSAVYVPMSKTKVVVQVILLVVVQFVNTES